jgi:hypothetical protein
MKKCTKCGIEKPLSEFNKNKLGKYGRRSRCKACQSQYYAQYCAQNKEKIAEYRKEYCAQNKEKIAEYRKEYRAQNKEKKAEYLTQRKAEEPNCIYQIKNLINNRVYIGETIRGEMRWKEHLCRLRGNYHVNKLLQEDFDKFGEEAFEWTILKEFESEDKDILLLEEARSIQQHIDEGVELYNLALTIEQLKMLTEDK